MTPKDHPVWNKMAVLTLDTLEEAMRELKRREKIEKWRQHSKSHYTMPDRQYGPSPDQTNPKA